MEITVFSDKKNIEQCFVKVVKAKGCSIHFFPVKDFAGKIKLSCEGNLIYLDITSVKEADKKKILNLIFKTKNARFGIIDSDNSIADVAELFFLGIVDYIGKNLYKTGITFKRIEAVFNFRTADFTLPESENKKCDDSLMNFISSGRDWTLVKPGKEYTFCFMYIELDNFHDMKKTAGTERAKKIMESFHNYIGNYVSSINGRIWMWMEYSGLILFPFDGSKCDAILSSFKLMLNRELINQIDLKMDYSYSYNIVMHLGNTIFRERGETGTIVSDSINSIFHLGQKYAEDQNFYLTESMERYIPSGVRDYFIPSGEFEGRKIIRMKKLL